METVAILWTFFAAVAMTLAAVCGSVWLAERRDLTHLTLCILGIATAASAWCELRMMQSASVPEYIEWLRWYFFPVCVALVSQLLFVHYYLGKGRAWLMWTVIAARSGMVAVNFAVYPGYNFSRVDSLRHMPLFGDQVSLIGAAVVSQRQWFADVTVVLWAAYLVDAAARRWLEGDEESRRKALAVSLGIIFPMLFTNAYTQLIVFGSLQSPVSNVPWFLAALAMMAFELGRDFILSRRERLELAELRGQLAQVERVSVLGQLASALAHELSQPLTACAANVQAGLLHLKNQEPDINELHAILDDIGRDGRRASQIIQRMRQLLKERTIDMQALRVDDVVQDAVALVRSETTAKNVTLHLSLPPALPRVLGDRVHLTQVLLNLLVNSVHALLSCPPGARHIFVVASADDAKGEVEIAVQDSGPGIPSGILDQVFEPFFTTKSNGTGIGLALSRTIIDAHGGRLWCDDVPLKTGATFRFTMRQAPKAEVAVEKAPPASSARKGAVEGAPA